MTYCMLLQTAIFRTRRRPNAFSSPIHGGLRSTGTFCSYCISFRANPKSEFTSRPE
jgi:hypothetical protein